MKEMIGDLVSVAPWTSLILRSIVLLKTQKMISLCREIIFSAASERCRENGGGAVRGAGSGIPLW